MLNGREVLFPSGAFNYVLPDVVYLGYAVDLTDPLHLRCVGVLEEAFEAVRASNILRNESGPLLDMRLVVYDSQRGNSTVLAGIISKFAVLPHSLGIIGGLLSGERAEALQSMVARVSAMTRDAAGETASMLPAAAALSVGLLSPSATATALREPPLATPFFQRVVRPDSVQGVHLADLTQRLGWHRMTGPCRSQHAPWARALPCVTWHAYSYLRCRRCIWAWTERGFYKRRR